MHLIDIVNAWISNRKAGFDTDSHKSVAFAVAFVAFASTFDYIIRTHLIDIVNF